MITYLHALVQYLFQSIHSNRCHILEKKKLKCIREQFYLFLHILAPYENPPHVYALSDNMFRNLITDNENQCVIISGESGAGKTVAAKYIMSYIARVSGGGQRVQKIKDVILESNPLLEAFGNAKTIRNNNSSRFGKYVEIQFGSGGQPEGGKVSNFLLEKSRVVSQNADERSFHIFYQLCCGANQNLKKELGLTQLDYYNYLKGGGGGKSGSHHKVDGTDDVKEFKETLKAMEVMGITGEEQDSVLRTVSAVLHIGNITFAEKGNYASVKDNSALAFPAYLLEIKDDQLSNKLTSRKFDGKWGAAEDSIDVKLNEEQANYTRDALAKAIYARLFDKLVERVNRAMRTPVNGNCIGILDIYGFEIFYQNGFEQFCINFVNEKLQQIFIHLTLKAEQEEYMAEHIKWTPIDYFNNAIVVELVEGRSPPGVFCVLDDVCATKHAVTKGIDSDFHKKLNAEVGKHKHYSQSTDGFVIHHYAGSVTYCVDGFCDRNRDVLFQDLIELMQSSTNPFIRELFADSGVSSSNVNDKITKSRPTTAGSKIRNQANQLVSKLMSCTPHYIRCIKPNETKRAKEFDGDRVKHQVVYLGLCENIRVRRAGFAFRRTFSKFLQRYGIVTDQTWPRWRGEDRQGVEYILNSVGLNSPMHYQLGVTKVFIKQPESLFLLEEKRDRKFNFYARIIQRAFRKYFARQRNKRQKQEACMLLFGKKERRKYSLNRNFACDYIGVDSRPGLLRLLGPREKVSFAEIVKKYNRRFKFALRDLVLTNKALYLIGRDKNKKHNLWNASEYIEVIKRRIVFDQIADITLSTLQDDFVVIHLKTDYDSFLEMVFKTEFLHALSKAYKTSLNVDLKIKFSNSCDFRVKKIAWSGGGVRNVKFESSGMGDMAILNNSGKTLIVKIGSGLPSDSKPNMDSGAGPVIINNRGMIVEGVTTAGRGRVGMSMPPAPSRSAPPPPEQQQQQPQQQTQMSNIRQGPRGSIRAPPPPSEPAPPNQPTIWSTQQGKTSGIKSEQRTPQPTKKKPAVPLVKPVLVRAKALYNYSAQDLDELSFSEGDVIEIIKEYDGGWWHGKLAGKVGLLPANYVQKL
ncbi:unconventional myosin-Ie-like isoform X2 [Lycorma delicatula]|uniref:unconventional myosin-Ie-like isoform X2 n=1 Tax=Lycorma delicatula TaxID=130591 RepID=UPI003F50F58C